MTKVAEYSKKMLTGILVIYVALVAYGYFFSDRPTFRPTLLPIRMDGTF